MLMFLNFEGVSDIIPRRHKRLGRASANPLALQLHTQPPNIIPNLPPGLGETFTRDTRPVYAKTRERSQGKCQFNASTANSRTLLPAHPRPRVLRRSRVRSGAPPHRRSWRRMSRRIISIGTFCRSEHPTLDLEELLLELARLAAVRRNEPNLKAGGVILPPSHPRRS